MCESEQQFCSHSQTHKKTEFLCSSTDPPIISNSNLIPYTYNTILNEEGANKKKWLNIFNKVYFNSSQENRAHPQITRNKHYNNQQAASEFRMRKPKRVSRVDYVCVRMLCAVFGGRRFMLCLFMFHIIFYRTQPHTHKHFGLPSELLKTSFPYTTQHPERTGRNNQVKPYH